MKKYVKAVTNLVIALMILLLVVILVPRVLVFFLPFVVGWIIAWIASPVVRFFEEKLKVRRKASSALVIIVVIGLVALVLYLAGAKLAEEVIGLVDSLPVMWESVEAEFAKIGENLNVIYRRLPQDAQVSLSNVIDQITDYLGDFVGRISSPTITAVGNFAKQLPAILIGVIMAMLSAYFFVSDRHHINAWCKDHIPAVIQRRWQMLRNSLVKAVGGYLKAQLRIEVWMYLLLVIGLTVLQVDYALLIALGIACLDFLPFFGTGTVMVPWAIIKILSSDYKMAVGLLIIWAVGQLARQLIQPKIVGDSVGVPPLPTLFLLYIGYKLSGVIGMIVAVPIGLIVFTLYEEGAFDTTKNSILILLAGINRFRKLTAEDMEVVEEMRTGENGTVTK